MSSFFKRSLLLLHASLFWRTITYSMCGIEHLSSKYSVTTPYPCSESTFLLRLRYIGLDCAQCGPVGQWRLYPSHPVQPVAWLGWRLCWNVSVDEPWHFNGNQHFPMWFSRRSNNVQHIFARFLALFTITISKVFPFWCFEIDSSHCKDTSGTESFGIQF